MKSVIVDKVNRFSISTNEEKRYFISIPVSNPYVDYEEHYEISKREFEQYIEDTNLALEFVKECKDHKHDELLLEKPGKYRGIAT